MNFENPYVFLLFIPLLVFVVYYMQSGLFRGKMTLALGAQKDEKEGVLQFMPFLRYLALGMLLVAAASPYEDYRILPDQTKGVDIMMAIDVSGSMVQSRDFLPENRLTVAKSLTAEFVFRRKNDRLGLVVFAGGAYLQSPLTSDLQSLVSLVGDLDPQMVTEQGTAIGDALVLSVYRLNESRAASRIIILMTDGVSNTGKFDPATATDITLQSGIKVYSIGIGLDEDVDFAMLQGISDKTSGKFFRARTADELQQVMLAIDRLEKDILAGKQQIILEKKFGFWLFCAIVLLGIDLVFRTFVRRYYV